MKVYKLSRYEIVARSQHFHQSPKDWVTMSAIIKQNYQFPEWVIVNIQQINQFPIWKSQRQEKKGDTPHLIIKSKSNLIRYFERT